VRILIVKQLFNPEPTARSLDFASALKNRGHDVQVLTGFPNYPKGKIYDGYRQKLVERSTMDGIDLVRVPVFPYHGTSGLKRILNYMSYAFSATLIGLWYVRKPDVIFAYQGALPVSIPAIFAKWFKRAPLVYDINDLWPDTLSATGMMKNKLLLKVVDMWCNRVYKIANNITVLSKGFKNRLIQRGVSEDKVKITYHWSRDTNNGEVLSEDRYNQFFKKDAFNLLYAGNIGVSQEITTVIKAIHGLSQEGRAIQLVLLGDGADLEACKSLVEGLKTKAVTFVPRVTSQEVSGFLNSADGLMVHLRNEPLFRITIPSKIISYIQTGKPIVLGVQGDAEEIINVSKTGEVVEPSNVESIKEGIKKVMMYSEDDRNTLKESAQRFYQDHFEKEKIVSQYIEIFKNVQKN